MERRDNGSFLLSSPSGELRLSGAWPPMRWQRTWRLFWMTELAVPAHAAALFPLRASLAADGALLSAGDGGAVAAAAPVACCAEEWLLELPPLTGSGEQQPAPVFVWAGDGRRLLSAAAAGGGLPQLVLRGQHAMSGCEAFTLRTLHRHSNTLTLHWRPPAAVPGGAAPGSGDAGGGGGGGGGGGEALALEGGPGCELPVVAQAGRLVCAPPGAKPARLSLALASSCKPALLLTAHASVLGLDPAAAAAAAEARPWARRPASRAEAAAQGFLVHHHGDGVYTICHGASGRRLRLEPSGAPALSADPRLHFPDPRLLWVVQRAAAPLPPAAAAAPPPGFLPPGAAPAGGALHGWTLRTLARVPGLGYLYLSAHPGGLVTTSHRVTRWELWNIADVEACLASALDPLQAVCQAAAEEECVAGAGGGMRRTASAASVASAGGAACAAGQPGRRLQSVRSTPALRSIPEEAEPSAGQAAPPAPRPPRRCASEPALTTLRAAPRPSRLALLAAAPAAPEGWGVCSPAPLVALAVRELAAAVLAAGAASSTASSAKGGGSELSAALSPPLPSPLLAPGALPPPAALSSCPGGHPHAARSAERAASPAGSHPDDCVCVPDDLPAELAALVDAELDLLCSLPPETKVSAWELKTLADAGAAPPWAEAAAQDAGAAAPDSHLCAACAGASGLLLPMDKWVNPQHHQYLQAMARQARAGRAPRRRGGGAAAWAREPDGLTSALQVAKFLLLVTGACRLLGALAGRLR
eukprot:scaffold11.g3953.t1